MFPAANICLVTVTSALPEKLRFKWQLNIRGMYALSIHKLYEN